MALDSQTIVGGMYKLVTLLIGNVQPGGQSGELAFSFICSLCLDRDFCNDNLTQIQFIV